MGYCQTHGYYEEGYKCFKCQLLETQKNKSSLDREEALAKSKLEKQRLDQENAIAKNKLALEKDRIRNEGRMASERIQQERESNRRLERIEREKARAEQERTEAELERTELTKNEINRKRNNKFNQFLNAASSGDTDIIDDLIVRDGSIDIDETYEGQTALLMAIKTNQADMINHLLKRGADANKSLIACINSENKYPENVIIKLLDLGADISIKGEDGSTLLHRVVADKNIELAQKIIERGADINARNGQDRTPLHLALLNT